MTIEPIIPKLREAIIASTVSYLTDRESGCKTVLRISDDKILELYNKHALCGQVAWDAIVHYVIDDLLDIQGGLLIFIDDERSISQVTSESGLYITAGNIWDSAKALGMSSDRHRIRHVFFDYWLSERHTTQDIAYRAMHSSRSVLSDNFTYSVHSADDTAKDIIGKIIGKDKAVKYQYPKPDKGNADNERFALPA